ncbi:MAG: hypothetical protein H6741_25290 [Alphaproteobacteria bacterium]|nr:hypothetical protein [Alphaproteobacteria bacterium]
MSVKRMRPTFRMVLPLGPPEVLHRVRVGLDAPDCLVAGTMGRHGFELKVSPEHEHLWSPWLTVEVRPHEQGSELYARFSPKPEVWTFFIALYALFGFVGLCGLVWGGAQLTLGGDLTGLLLVPGAALACVGVYAASFIGQGLGGAQMYVLRRFLDQTLPPPESAQQSA